MITIRKYYHLVASCVFALLAVTACAEDFSVHLDDLVVIDTTRTIPEYKLERVLTRSQTDNTDMPEKSFDIFIRFKEFGSVRLDEANEAGPSTGKMWTKGMVFGYGLANLADVKAAWIRDAPNLFIVAWVQEPDNRGNAHTYAHGYVILQLKNHQAQVLLRSSFAINASLRNDIQVETLAYPRFSFDPMRDLLEEQLTRSYELASDRPHDLGRLRKDEGGNTFFVASIKETVILKYKLVDSKLVPESCNLIYKTQKQNNLSEIARFYLGPFASNQALLTANPNLATKYKGANPKNVIYLDAGQDINIPVPSKWLIDNFAHGLDMKP